MRCLYTLEINSLLVTLFEKIFSHSVVCLFFFFFLMVSFTMQKLVGLSLTFIFVFIFITLEGESKKILLWFMSKSVLPMFSFRSFIVSGLTFRCLIHFEFFVCMVLENVLISFSYKWFSSFTSTIYWRDYLSSTVCFCLLHHILVDPRCLGLFLGFLSCSIDLYFCFCASAILFWWL